jgi:hypothetical protein
MSIPGNQFPDIVPEGETDSRLALEPLDYLVAPRAIHDAPMRPSICAFAQ